MSLIHRNNQTSLSDINKALRWEVVGGGEVWFKIKIRVRIRGLTTSRAFFVGDVNIFGTRLLIQIRYF